MNLSKAVTVGILIASFLAAPLTSWSAEVKADKQTGKAKPYSLKTCVVSDEKLGEMGDPYVFNYEGREIKLCCKSCKKDFDKASAKYIKKIEKVETAAAKKS